LVRHWGMSAGARGESGLVVLAYPFSGRWLTRNSPARRVSSHATHLMGTTYAIDFIAVDEHGHSAPWNWRAALATEAPKTFIGFGAPVQSSMYLPDLNPHTVCAAHTQARPGANCRRRVSLVVR
jgi:hypothetical protein